MTRAAKQSSWLPDILASLAAASGIGYLITVYGVSRWLTRPTRSVPQSPLWDADCAAEDLVCTTADGLRLVGWVVSPANPIATVALFHGMRCSRKHVVERIDFLTRAGYRCVAFDHRGHGQSEGSVTSFGYHEAQDVWAVRDLMRRHWPYDRCAALGMSMGAAALCYAGSCDWDALILEGPYHDLSTAFRTRIGGEYPRWFRIFAGGVIRLTELRLGRRLDQMAPWQYVPNLAPAPILLLTGQHDSHATPQEVEKLHRCCEGPSEFHVIPDANHVDVLEKGGSGYESLVLDFLGRSLRQRQSLAA